MADYGKLNFSVAFAPTSAFPLDSRTVFNSYEEALEAARTAGPVGSTKHTRHFGMILTVVDSVAKTETHYTITHTNGLRILEKEEGGELTATYDANATTLTFTNLNISEI